MSGQAGRGEEETASGGLLKRYRLFDMLLTIAIKVSVPAAVDVVAAAEAAADASVAEAAEVEPRISKYR